MSLQQICEAIESLSLATAIRESPWLYPAIESAHVLAIALVVGSILIVDLRLLGLASTRRRVTVVSRETLPITWIAFSLAVVTGVLLFISRATLYYDNIPFRVKLLLIAAAGLNMLYFHFMTYRNIAEWDEAAPILAARIGATLSIVLWLSVVTFGRWIGFV